MKVTPKAIKEAIYQATAYVGMGRVKDYLLATNEVFEAFGVTLSIRQRGTTTRKNHFEKGLAVQKAIFGEVIDKMRENAPTDLKHIQDFLSANCFGDYYTKEWLDLKFRELLTFVYLAALGHAQPQLNAHAVGNIKLGNDRKRLISVVTALTPYICYPKTLNAITAIEIATKN